MKTQKLYSVLILLLLIFTLYNCSTETQVSFINNSENDLYSFSLQVWDDDSPESKYAFTLDKVEKTQTTGKIIYDGNAGGYLINYSYYNGTDTFPTTRSDKGQLKGGEKNTIVLNCGRIIQVYASGN